MGFLDFTKRAVVAAIIAIGTAGVSSVASAQATQGDTDCFLAVYLEDGTIIDFIAAEGHFVINKNKSHLVCHGESEAAAALLQHAEIYRSACFGPGGGTFELTELNVTTPGGRVHFVCHLP